MKNSLEGQNGKIQELKLRTYWVGSTVKWTGQKKESEIKNRIINIIQYEQQRENRLKNNELILRDLSNYNKRCANHID